MPEQSAQQIVSPLIDDRFIDPVIRFLETFFSTFPHFTWDEDEAKSGILIMDHDTFNLEKVDARPRVVVELQEWTWRNLAIDNLQHLDLVTTAVTQTDLAVGTVICHCVSSQQLEAKHLGSVVAQAVRIFRAELRKEGNFAEVDSASYGRVQRIRSSSQSETRSVPVTLRLSLKYTYTMALDEARYQAAGG